MNFRCFTLNGVRDRDRDRDRVCFLHCHHTTADLVNFSIHLVLATTVARCFATALTVAVTVTVTMLSNGRHFPCL